MATNYNSRRLVHVGAERVSNVASTDFPGHYPDEDHSWNLQRFKENLRIKVQRLSNRSIDFDLVGVDASIANAFRRILIAEVPTIAVERVYVWDNTSVIVDEVLSHRLGLVPLNVDPALMQFKTHPDDIATDRNTLVFSLNVTCTRNPNPPPKSDKEPLPSELYINHEVLSGHFVWKPAGDQKSVFEGLPTPGPTNLNIVLNKLRPGQTVSMELHAVKGVGKDHAKFSPVATASYRLLPHIKITKPIPPHLAEKFQKCFSPGVIKFDPVSKEVYVDEENVRKDSVSREVLRHPEFVDSVELGRVRDFFLFNIESESAYPPERLFPESIRVMREKISVIRNAAEALKAQLEGTGDVEMAEA
ncbi:DNA-directed RNA polymerases I and III subunit RPAC1 [Leucoagaricus sp. SymC.cos]|nr:DNA-directed RNA polymerases I and III subunit RPAC1 [Leucoagaricus sp. SymC.cos]